MSEAKQVEELLHPISFPPDVLNRIAPDLSLQRHLAIGLRPSLRGFEEFKPVHIHNGGLSRYDSESLAENNSPVLGSAIVKSGDTRVVCGITGGIIEENNSNDNELEYQNTKGKNKESVYPVVEISRGRSGAPTDEEMILSQKLYETLLHSNILTKHVLRVKVGIKSQDKDGKSLIFYPEDVQESLDYDITPKRKWSFVLYAHLKVFSRQGPLFDLLWGSLIAALQNVKLPQAYIDERAADIKIAIKSRGNFGTIRENYTLMCDSTRSYQLELNRAEIGWCSTLGLIDLDKEVQATIPQEEDEDNMDIDKISDGSVLLADIEGEAEESSALSKVSVLACESDDKILKHVSITGGGSKITKEVLQKAIQVSKLRSKHILGSC